MRRHPLVSVVIYIALVVALVFVIAALVSLFVATPATSATCGARPGLSHGKIWWRWRYDRTGARCWYPGTRYGKRRYHRVAMLRLPQTKAEKLTPTISAEKSTLVEPIEAVRTVRIIPIYGHFTVQERIERAFDKLLVFPVEDEP